jgi:MerR family transcriptional regulator, light-induced transcriptional regulator
MTVPPFDVQPWEVIQAQQEELIEAVMAEVSARRPELDARYGARGRAACLEDTRYHLRYLATAMGAAQSVLFADYISWVQATLAARGISADDLAATLECLRDILVPRLPEALRVLARTTLAAGLGQLPQALAPLPPMSAEGEPLVDLARDYLDALLHGERPRAFRLILDAVQAGVELRLLYLHVFQRTQHELGRLWQLNHIGVAHEHYCTAATQLLMAQLYPAILATARTGRRFVAACVTGELHELGTRMVADLLELEGWDTYYLGANTPADSVVRMVVDRQAHVVGISATMPFHVSAVAALVAAVQSAEACKAVKVLVGGYPFTRAPDLWQCVGADGYARDAQEAVDVANRLVAAGGA